jgi:hypothetical protein
MRVFSRRIFPEDCFVLQDYAGMEVHQLDCVEKAASGEVRYKIRSYAAANHKWVQLTVLYEGLIQVPTFGIA